MGLEQFKTENPRTRGRGSKKTSYRNTKVVHLMQGCEMDKDIIPGSIEVHTAVMSGVTDGINNPDIDTGDQDVEVNCICRECKSVSRNYQVKLKVDRLKFKDSDWFDEFFDHAVDRDESTDIEDKLDGYTLDNKDTDEFEDSTETETTQDTTGSKSDDDDSDDDSIFGSFMS